VNLLSSLENLSKIGFALGLLLMAWAYTYKDALPDPDFYPLWQLTEPRQSELRDRPFEVQAGDQTYRIEPKYAYELDGVVVSYHDSDSISDIYHDGLWADFINVRDLCVIWGDNVANGVYRDMQFKNTTWTCWAYWPDRATGARFDGSQLSNNHLLADNDDVKRRIMEAEPGDQIRLRGYLASYSNLGNGFSRGTSVTRTDRGNGACETVYVTDFEVMGKANRGWRRLFSFAAGLTVVSVVGVLLMTFVAPVRNR
jgi:hypothetical protein